MMKNPSKSILILSVLMITNLFLGSATAQESHVDIRTFATKMYIHGIPYTEAKAYGNQAVPELLKMLYDTTLEKYWVDIISILGYIGDSSAVTPLLDFLKRQKGEISVHAFRATLVVFQALGHISQDGNQEAITTLINWTRARYWQEARLNSSYKRYKDEALGEVLGRMAIQALGISGKPQALQVLQDLNSQQSLRADWHDNVKEAIDLNIQVSQEGAQKVFGQEVEQ